MIVQQGERQSPGSLETMVEDAATRLVTAMRALRETSDQKQINQLREVVEGQSNRLHYLTY